MKSFITLFVACLALEAGTAAQSSAPSIQVDAHAAAHAKLLQARAALAPLAFQEQVVAPSHEAVMTNTGQLSTITFQGHVLSVASEGSQGATKGAAIKILYAPSEADDPAYRAAIGAAAGGATVDYFDTRVATPSVATLLQYDAVYAWVNFPLLDPVGMGNNLASYNDNGGNVVLGVFCTFTSGNSMGGTIMTAAYSPVESPLGTNHFSVANYIGDGTTCIYNGVPILSCIYRDFLTVEGTGVKDGTYSDNETVSAYRSAAPPGSGTVAYSNGAGAIQLAPTAGPWATAVANMCTCVTNPNAWVDQGSALAGVSGDPLLEGSGGLVPTTRQFLELSNAAPSAMSAIYASGSSSPTPFKGGTLLPGPALITVFLNTDASGGWELNFRAPAAASGTEIWVQVAIQDAAAVQGVSLSNAVKGTTP